MFLSLRKYTLVKKNIVEHRRYHEEEKLCNYMLVFMNLLSDALKNVLPEFVTFR